MQPIGYPLLGLIAGASLLAACGSDLSPHLNSLTNVSQSRSEADPETFVRHLSNGSEGMMYALAEMNHAVGREQVADDLEAFLATTPGPWDASTFEAAWAKTDTASIPAEAQFNLAGGETHPHIVNAWALSSYAGYMHKLAFDEANDLVGARSVDPTMISVVETSAQAARILPSQIETASVIATRSATFMTENGIPRPSVEEVSKIIAQRIGDTDMKDIQAIFG